MEGESPTQASPPTGAVFLSYASQDSEAAQRICAALRSAGIEVWFDQSELRGGDAWDRQIRERIHDCRLFVAVISANTEARDEGYFRREWKLAVDRTHDMSEKKAFLVPVVVDDTPERGAAVPDKFRDVQWTRLPEGATAPPFVERIKRLLSPEAVPATVDGRPAAAAVPHAATASRQPAAGPATSIQKQSLLLIAVVTLIGLGYFAVDKLVLSKREAAAKPAAVQPSQAATPAQIPDKSIAVLPFVDMSEKHDQEYFSDGLSEELLDLLAKTEGLQVIARTSSFYFKGKQVTITEIANTLHVAHVLEGSVRKAGGTMRVTAQLIRAKDGVHLWSDTYDRDFKDVFKVQDEIAAAVVKALQIKLLPSPVKSESEPHNTDAYSLYLRGQYFARRASDVDVERGIASLKEAIARAPDFAPAHAELASAYVYAATFGTGTSTSLDQARAEVDEALRLDPTLRLAQDIRMNIAFILWDWASAKTQIDQALKSAPNDPEALFRRGSLERALGRPDEALVYYHKALELDPLRVGYYVQLAMLLDGLGRPDEARAAAQTAIAISPTVSKAHLLLGLFELNSGHLDAASAEMERESGDYYRLEGRAIVAFANKRMAESDAALAQLIEAFHDGAAVQIAQAYAYRGERAKALDWLDRAVIQRDPGLINIKTDPLFAGLRGDSRYRAVLRKMNLPE
jgi:TolB-like protein/Tfp pilus assembly protein PilF